MKIIYVNGFQGGGPSAKIDALKEEFGAENVFNPYIPARFSCAMNTVHNQILQIPQGEPIIFVGTSLGGYIAMVAAHTFGEKSVILNPCLRPSNSLQKYIGKEVDGAIFTTEDWFEYNESERDQIVNFGNPCIVLCETGDTVIPVSDVITNLNLNERYHPELRVFSGGNHRFSNYPEMINAIYDIMYTETV